MIIDFHNHYYPPEYLDALRQGPTAVQLSTDAEGNPVIGYPGDYNVAVRGHRDIAYREGVLAHEGVDMQVLTLTTPGTHIESPSRAAGLARLVNDAFAAAAVLVAASQVAANPRTSAFGLALVLTGLPVYALWVRRPSLPPTPLSPS